VFVNQLDATKYTAASEFGARSLMAVPLVAFNEVIGATTFLHDSDEEFFNEDLAARLPSWQVNWQSSRSLAAERGLPGGASPR